MRKIFLIVFAFLALALPAFADPIITNTSNGSAVVYTSFGILDFTTLYNYQGGGSRNSLYPGYEYMLRNGSVHFWAKIDAESQYSAEHAIVKVGLRAGNNGCPGALWDEIPLAMVTGTSATYDVSTGRYVAEYEGDFIIPTDPLQMPSGNYMLYVVVYSPYNGSVMAYDDLSSIIYTNVNDILVLGDNDLTLTVQGGGLTFNLIPNSYSFATEYPKHMTLSSPVDREGQGIIGDISIAVTDYIGNNQCTPGVPDILSAGYIQMNQDGGLVWTWLMPNTYPLTINSNWVVLATNQATTSSGDFCSMTSGSYKTNLYFKIFYDANHCSTVYEGGQIGVKYSVY